MMMRCEACVSEGKTTTMAWDPVGVALMQQHLLSEHGVQTPPWEHGQVTPLDEPRAPVPVGPKPFDPRVVRR